MHIKRAFYFGLVGSLGGVLIVSISMVVMDMKLYSTSMGISAILFSLLALLGCFLLKRDREILAGFLMLISAVGGIIAMSLFYVVPGFLLIIAGIMTILNKKEHAEQIE